MYIYAYMYIYSDGYNVGKRTLFQMRLIHRLLEKKNGIFPEIFGKCFCEVKFEASSSCCTRTVGWQTNAITTKCSCMIDVNSTFNASGGRWILLCLLHVDGII